MNTISNHSEFESQALRIAHGVSLASERHPERNEDNLIIDNQNDLYGVFDGVGGYAGGEIASQTVASTAQDHAGDISKSDHPENVALFLKQLLIDANQNILDKSNEAASTAVFAKIHEHEGTLYATVAHVGDSRAYTVHDGVLTAMTTDHTPSRIAGHTMEAMAQQERLAEVVDVSTLSSNSIHAFRYRNIIGALLGRDDEVKMDVKHFVIQKGDYLILTSDGVHDNLTTSEMQAIVRDVRGADYAISLTNAANARAKESHTRAKMDDITAVVVAI